MHIITQTVLPGELVFDIGANIGDKTEWFANRGMRVVSVEPQPKIADHLRRRFAGHPLVTVIEKGLADQPGHLQMSISDNHTLSTFTAQWKEGRFKGETWNTEATVEMTTLDLLVEQYGSPRYIKVDVEGFEKQVLSGLSRKGQIGCLSFEFTSEIIEQAEAICERLAAIGFTYFNASLGEQEIYVYQDRWRSRREIMDALLQLMSQDKLLWGDVYAA